MSYKKCIFYQSTRDGDRCIFLPPEEWKARKSKLQEYCLSGGKNCPILAHYYKIMEENVQERNRG